MVTKDQIFNLVRPQNTKTANSLVQGGVGYDNARENIDPFIKTKILSSKEIITHNLNNIRFADQFQTLQEAIDNIPATGGTLFLPAGTYLINQSITLNKPLSIIGEGIGKTILQATGTEGDGLKNTSVTSNIIIRDLTMDMNNKNMSGMGLYNITNLFIENVEVKNVAGNTSADGYGIYIYDCENVIVANCIIDNIAQRDGIQFKGVINGTIKDCYISNVTGIYGIDSHDSLTRLGEKIHILNNIIDTCARGIDCQESYSVINGNSLKDINTYGIDVRLSPESMVIANNIIRGISGGSTQPGISLYNSTAPNYLKIIGNQISNFIYGVYLSGGTNITCMGNTFYNNSILDVNDKTTSSFIIGNEGYLIDNFKDHNISTTALISGGQLFASNGFTGSGAYTNFTISGGIIISAS